MSTLHWKIRLALPELRGDGRLAVIVCLLSHANIRMRCWPGVELITDETGWSSASVSAAKKWLLGSRAIILVPFQYRVDEELALPPRQHIYQLTGIMQLSGGKIVPYLFLNPEAEAEIRKVVEGMATPDNPLLAKTLPTETSLGKDEGITISEAESTTQDQEGTGGPKTPAPKKKQSKRQAQGIQEPAEGVLDAFCIFLYGDLSGWKLNAWRIQNLYNEIAGKFSPPTIEDVRRVYSWWKAEDFRGKKGERPEPAQLIEKWSIGIAYRGKGKFNNDKQTDERKLLGKQSGNGGGWGFKTAKPKQDV